MNLEKLVHYHVPSKFESVVLKSKKTKVLQDVTEIQVNEGTFGNVADCSQKLFQQKLNYKVAFRYIEVKIYISMDDE